MLEEIKVCPNCRCKNCNVVWWAIDGIDVAAVECPKCELRGPVEDYSDDAIKKWNALPRKAEIARVEKEMNWLAAKMPKCPYDMRYEIDIDEPSYCDMGYGEECTHWSTDCWKYLAREAVEKQCNE